MPDYETLDPGIRDTVALLNRHGFQTTDSGDGVSKPADWYVSGEAIPFPHVVALVTITAMISEAHRMATVLGAEWVVEVNYSTRDRVATLFARPLTEQERVSPHTAP